jgi:transcriptional regulator with XRE-family HTH domain
MAEIDGDWFHRQLDERGQSLRALARHLGKDASAVSRTFSGRRRMTMEEAGAIAAFLGVAVTEVMHHAGIAGHGGAPGEGAGATILLSATIGEDGALGALCAPQPLPQPVLDRARLALAGRRERPIAAAQVRARAGALSMWDDTVLLFAPAEGIEPGAIGALSICGLADGRQLLARLDRARKTGEASLVLPDGGIADVVLVTAAPVLLVVP